MIKLNDFVNSIQQAILGANQHLKSQHQDLIGQYFEPETDHVDLESLLSDCLSELESLSDHDSVESLKNLKLMIARLREKIKKQSQQYECSHIQSTEVMRPKLVSLSMPMQTEDGVQLKEIQVPLITLVPMSMPSIEEVKIVTDTYMEIVEDEVNVSFGTKPVDIRSKNDSVEQHLNSEPSGHGCVGKIEITIRPGAVTDGMKTVIEAYEKTLRAQMP